jgi:methyl-accepting chemotaxis protein
MIFNLFRDLWLEPTFVSQMLTWLSLGSLFYLIWFVIVIVRDVVPSSAGRRSLRQITHSKRNLSPAELYASSLEEISDHDLSEKVVSKWIQTQAQLTNIQRKDFSNHVLRYFPGFYNSAPGVARYFLLLGLFFTFLALSNTFLNFKNASNLDSITIFIQDDLIPGVAIALTSTLVAILFSMLSIFTGMIVENYVNRFRTDLEEYLITIVSPQNPTGNPIENTTHLVNIHTELSGIVLKTIDALKKVSETTSRAYSDLSDATNNFVQAFEVTQVVIQSVEKNQERMAAQNDSILTSSTALKDSVIGIQKIFLLEDSALREVREAISGSNRAITENSKQLSGITLKFHEYNDNLGETLDTTNSVLRKVSASLEKLNSSHENNSEQVSKYVEIVTQNISSVDTAVIGIGNAIGDANKIQSEIAIQVGKLKETSEEFASIKDDAIEIGKTSERLTNATNRIVDSTSKTQESIQSFTENTNAVKTLLNEYDNVGPGLDRFDDASKKFSNFADDVSETQRNLLIHSKELGSVSDKFNTTYNRYVNKLKKVETRPSNWSRLKKYFLG